MIVMGKRGCCFIMRVRSNVFGMEEFFGVFFGIFIFNFNSKWGKFYSRGLIRVW